MSMDMRNQIETRRLGHNALFSRQSFTCYKAIEQPITRGPGAQQQFPIDYHRPRKQGVVTLVSVVALVKLVALSNRGGLVKAVTKFWTPPWIPKMSQKAYKLWSDMRFNLCKILNVQSNFSILGLVLLSTLWLVDIMILRSTFQTKFLFIMTKGCHHRNMHMISGMSSFKSAIFNMPYIWL